MKRPRGMGPRPPTMGGRGASSDRSSYMEALQRIADEASRERYRLEDEAKDIEDDDEDDDRPEPSSGGDWDIEEDEIGEF